MTQVESIRVARTVLVTLAETLMETGEDRDLDLAAQTLRVEAMLRQIQLAATLVPAEFREFAVGTGCPKTSEN